MKHRYLILAVLVGLSGVLLALLALLSMPFATMSGGSGWDEDIPQGIRESAQLPDAVLDEKPCDWRPVLEPLFRPVVKDCTSAREATLAIASRIGELTGVRYDMERRHPCMNALEALAEKKVSCTGQSILLVCALRSVGIPARAVGVATWNHVRGNHTWVEAWFEGSWHMIEFNEKDFNTPWVMEAVGMLNPQTLAERVLAVQPGGSWNFPTPWNPGSGIRAEDVTERYLGLARTWYAANGVPEGMQKLLVDALPRTDQPLFLLQEDADGREMARVQLPSCSDDVRRYATLLLPRGQTCFLHIEGQPLRYALEANESPARTLKLPAVLP